VGGDRARSMLRVTEGRLGTKGKDNTREGVTIGRSRMHQETIDREVIHELSIAESCSFSRLWKSSKYNANRGRPGRGIVKVHVTSTGAAHSPRPFDN
jgi:hypothetical protein